MERFKFQEMLEQAKIPGSQNSGQGNADAADPKKDPEEPVPPLGVKEAEAISAKCDEMQNLLYAQKQLLRENREILSRTGDCCNLDSSQMSIDLSDSGDDDNDADALINSEVIKAKEEEWNKHKEQYEKK